jgi:hypothetical protein
MVVIVRDRVLDAIDRGLSLREIRAAELTRDYDGEFAGDADAFVESIHASLVAGR